MARWIALRGLVWGLKRRLEPGEALDAIVTAFPRKPPAWRLELLNEALARCKRAPFPDSWAR